MINCRFRFYLLFILAVVLFARCKSGTDHTEENKWHKLDSLLGTFPSIKSYQIAESNNTVRLSIDFSSDVYRFRGYSYLIFNQVGNILLYDLNHSADSLVIDYDMKDIQEGFTLGDNIKVKKTDPELSFKSCSSGRKLIQYLKDSLTVDELKVFDESYAFARNRYYQLRDCTQYVVIGEELDFVSGIMYVAKERCNAIDTTYSRKERILIGSIYYTSDSNANFPISQKSKALEKLLPVKE